MNSLKNEFWFVNYLRPSNKGILDAFLYLGRIKYFFFNWPENIVEKKFGLVQTLFLSLLIYLLKMNDIKIIYVVHNKISHSQKRIRTKKWIAKVLFRKSNIFITHAEDGRKFICSMNVEADKIFNFPHPVDPPSNHCKGLTKDIDVLLWGNIAPYKGIDQFLKLLRDKKTDKLKIIIAGRASSSAYLKELQILKPENVSIINEFLEEKKIDDLISRSKIVVFPYHHESVISSGAFAKTLAHSVYIIGPDCGAFKDFNQLKNIYTFKKQELICDLIHKILRRQKEGENLLLDTNHILEKYSWERFGSEFSSFLSRFNHTNNE